MKKMILILMVAMAMMSSLTACSFQPTCKADGCEETEIYQDGYCKYHYYASVGDTILKDLFD